MISTNHLARELLTVRQFAERYPAWTERSLRALIFAAEDRVASRGRVIRGNGLRECGALVNCGRRVLLDPRAFLGPWLAAQQRTRRADR
jgi:hypothetical protein